jgi:hypothetical protein
LIYCISCVSSVRDQVEDRLLEKRKERVFWSVLLQH